MSRDPGPKDCCTYACNQGRDCPIRCKLNTHEGGARINTDRCLPQPTNAKNLFGCIDDLVLSARWPMFAIALICLSMAAGFFFNR